MVPSNLWVKIIITIVGTLTNDIQIKNTQVVCNRMITTVQVHFVCYTKYLVKMSKPCFHFKFTRLRSSDDMQIIGDMKIFGIDCKTNN